MWETLDRIDSPEDFIYDPSLVLYAPLHKKDGSSFMSDDAYGHLCTVTGALWTSQGRDFDGDDDIDLGDPASLNFGTGNFTVEAIVKVPPTAAQRLIVDKYIGIGWQLYVTSLGKAYWWTRDATYTTNNTCSSVSAIDDNIFHHLVGVRDGNNILLYVDAGTPVTNTPGDTNVTAAVDCTIGATRIPDTWLIGTIGEVRIYSRALIPLEIQRNYLASKWRYK